MTTIDIINPASVKDWNVGEFLFRQMVANEYQLELTNGEDVALVGFWKGDFTVKVNEHPIITISDGCFIQNKGQNPLHEGFIMAKLESCAEKSASSSVFASSRDYPASAIWSYIALLAPKFGTANFKIIVHLPGRNGIVTDDGLEVSRKDW